MGGGVSFLSFLAMLIGGSGLKDSSAPSLGAMADKKKTQGTHCHAISQVLRHPVGLSSSFHLSESAYDCPFDYFWDF